MLIHDLCAYVGVTRKAVLYAMEQGLLTPFARENGYRDFSHEDAQRMRQISTLRSLGLSTDEIRSALKGDWQPILKERAVAQAIAAEKQCILNGLACGGDWGAARDAIRVLMQRAPVTERLKIAFPGPFGDFLAAHFAPYLMQPIETQEQQHAWQSIVQWLDGTSFTVPEDLSKAWQAMSVLSNPETAAKIDLRMQQALTDQAAYLQAHAEEIRQYMLFKQSEAYQQSEAGRLEALIRSFMAQSGYNEVFIPLMRRLSPRYDAYQHKLQQANAVFLTALDENTKETPPDSCQSAPDAVQ